MEWNLDLDLAYSEVFKSSSWGKWGSCRLVVMFWVQHLNRLLFLSALGLGWMDCRVLRNAYWGRTTSTCAV